MSRIDTKRLKVELRRALRPFLLFVFLIACGLVSAGVIFKNQTFEKPWQDTYQVRATFDDVKGVTPGTQQVRIAGVKVGVIKKADLIDGRAVLTLSIDQKYGRLYRDARLRLRPATPLQDMYVAVERRGTRRAGVLDADTIVPAERTESPVDISQVMDTFDARTRKRLDVVLDGLGKGLADRGQALRAAFAQAAPFLQVAKRTTDVIARRRAATRRAVSNVGELTSALAERNRAVASLVGNGEKTVGELARNDTSLAATLRELPPTLSMLRGSLASLRGAQDELDPALRSLDPVLDRLDGGLDALERFGRDATPALASLRSPVRRLMPLARDLRPTARSLSSSMASLRPQTGRLDRITGLLPRCLERLSAFFSNTNSMAKFQDDEGLVITRAEATVSLDTVSPTIGGGPEPSYRVQPNCIDGGRRR